MHNNNIFGGIKGGLRKTCASLTSYTSYLSTSCLRFEQFSLQCDKQKQIYAKLWVIVTINFQRLYTRLWSWTPCCYTITLLVPSAHFNRFRRTKQLDFDEQKLVSVFAKMSWFHHVNQDSNQQGQYPFGNHGLSSTNTSCSGFNPCTRGPTVESPTVANERWGRCSALEDFPSVPADSPPSLEKLSGFSPTAGRVRDSGPVSYSLQEQRCVLSWFNGWNESQRERFLQDLLGKAVPGKVCTLLDSLSTLQVPCALNLLMHLDFF